MTPRSQFASICFIGKRDRDQRLAEELTSAGYEVCTFANSVDVVVQLAGNKKYSLILVSSEDEADLKFLPKICAAVKIPVIFLTHRGQWEILTAPELPFPWMEVIAFQNLNPGELSWRVQTLLLRSASAGFCAETSDFTWGGYRFINGSRAVVFDKGREVRLQERQFLFALMLFKNMGELVSRDDFLNSLGEPPQGKSRAIDVCAANVRRKLELREENGLVLRSIYRRGYLLIPLNSLAGSDTAETVQSRGSFQRADFSGQPALEI